MYKLVLDHQKYVTVICNLDGFGYHKYSHHQIYLCLFYFILLYLPLNICTVVLVIVSFLEALIAVSVVTDFM